MNNAVFGKTMDNFTKHRDIKLAYWNYLLWEPSFHTTKFLDNDSSIVYIKTDNIYKDISEDVATRFDISNYGLEFNSIVRPLPKGTNKKSNWINERWIRRH